MSKKCTLEIFLKLEIGHLEAHSSNCLALGPVRLTGLLIMPLYFYVKVCRCEEGKLIIAINFPATFYRQMTLLNL